MGTLVMKEYFMPDVDESKLKKLGFRISNRVGDAKESYFYLRFPLVKYLDTTTVEGEIMVNANNGSIRLNSYSSGTNNYYHPFYHAEDNEVYALVVKNINNTFLKKLDKLGIKEIHK